MTKKTIEKLTEKEIAYAVLNPEHNTEIVETAGFVPLEVKFQRFEQNGLIAQFHSSEFTSSDLRDIYLTPDYEINPEDDMETAFEKIALQQQFIAQIKQKKATEIAGGNSVAAPQADKQKVLDVSKDEPVEDK